MGRARAVCAQYAMPNGVTFCFQVCLYSIKPPVPNCAFNLFTKDNVKATLADEPEERRPKVARIILAVTFAGVTEGLAGAASSANRSVFGPSGKLEGERPSANAAEEMMLSKSGKLPRKDVGN